MVVKCTVTLINEVNYVRTSSIVLKCFESKDMSVH